MYVIGNLVIGNWPY